MKHNVLHSKQHSTGLKWPNFVVAGGLVAALMGLSACSQTPQYQQPKLELPEQVVADGALIKTGLQHETDFWQQFSVDKNLTTLLDQALSHNFDLVKAQANLNIARSYLTQAQAKLSPQLGVQMTAGLNQTSDNSYPQGQGAQFGQLSLAGLISYEIDLWGKNAANRDSAKANLQATEADYQALQLTVKSAVTEIYISLQALQQQLLIAEQTEKLRQRNLELRQSQLEYGSISALSVHQAKAELSAIKMVRSKLSAALALQKNALAQLLGASPKSLLETNMTVKPHDLTIHTVTLPSLLPSDVLQRRPDIIAAEARLKAANANIGVAKAALFPSLSLTGLLGFQSEALDRLLRDDSVAWNGQLGMNQSIFDAGSRQAGVVISEAQQQMALVNYQKTVSQAFAEVSDGLIKLEHGKQQIVLQQQQIEQLRQAYQLAQARFDSGYASYLEVLDTQRSLLDAELNLVNLQQQYQTAAVYLYKALGGVWQTTVESAQKNA